jgi:hypothetical protein
LLQDASAPREDFGLKVAVIRGWDVISPTLF